jgi:hypothetical protein
MSRLEKDEIPEAKIFPNIKAIPAGRLMRLNMHLTP